MDRKIGCLDRLGQGLDKAWTEKMGLLDGFGWCSEVPFSGLSKRLPGSSMIAWATRGTEKNENKSNTPGGSQSVRRAEAGDRPKPTSHRLRPEPTTADCAREVNDRPCTAEPTDRADCRTKPPAPTAEPTDRRGRPTVPTDRADRRAEPSRPTARLQK